MPELTDDLQRSLVRLLAWFDDPLSHDAGFMMNMLSDIRDAYLAAIGATGVVVVKLEDPDA